MAELHRLMSFENWYRARAIGGGLLLIPFLLFASYHFRAYNDKVVQKKPFTAEITAVEFRGRDEFKHFKTTVRLPDGESYSLNLKPSPAPRTGLKLPMLELVHESGKSHYELDRQSWEAQN